MAPSCGGNMKSFLLLCLVISGVTSQNLLQAILLDAKDVLFKSEYMELLERDCQFSRRPTIKSFELVYVVDVSCPGWAPFSGRASGTNPDKTVLKATKAFVEQAVKHGLVSAEEAKVWLQ